MELVDFCNRGSSRWIVIAVFFIFCFFNIRCVLREKLLNKFYFNYLLLFYSIEYYDFNYCVLTICFITRHVNHSFACSVFLDSSRHSSFYFLNITHLSVHRPTSRLPVTHFYFYSGTRLHNLGMTFCDI